MEVNDTRSLNDALAQLKQLRIPHRRYVETVRQISGAIFASVPGEVVCIIGPSRVGKTTATYEGCRLVLPEHCEVRETDMPIVKVRLRNSTKNGHYDSLLFIQSALAAIEHPFYGHPDEDDEFGIAFDRRLQRTSEKVLTNAFARAIKARRSKYLVIDEVQHLMYALKGIDGAIAILDSWKALAEELEIILILTGTYPILDILNKSPHMLGRMVKVEFAKYEKNAQDIRHFQIILNTLDEIIPFRGDTFANNTAFLFNGSLGCVGQLLRWIRSAIGQALGKGEDHITLQDLKNTQKTAAELATIQAEIDGGLDALRPNERAPASSTTSTSGTSGTSGTTNKSEKTTGRAFRTKQRNHKKGGRA